MTVASEVKKERMQIRLDAYSKKILERAASHSRKSISEFVLSHSLAAAERVLEEHEKITLADEDWDVFYEALSNPPDPNETLKNAYKKYRESKA